MDATALKRRLPKARVVTDAGGRDRLGQTAGGLRLDDLGELAVAGVDGGGAASSRDRRIQRERSFYNRCNLDGAEYGAGKYYSISRSGRRCFLEGLGGDLAGKRVLEYGCGPGSCGFQLARRGAHVTGIDISDAAIARAKDRARREGLTEAVFLSMNAEALEFPADAFDLVCGIAILHHLDLDLAYAELARVLRPGGRAVFIEPLGHNPLINLYRRWTPSLRTIDEHPLMMSDIAAAETCFDGVRARYFHLFSLLAVPFRDRPGFTKLLAGLEMLDRAAFRLLPPIRRHAWTCVLTLSRPLKNRPDRQSKEPARGSCVIAP